MINQLKNFIYYHLISQKCQKKKKIIITFIVIKKIIMKKLTRKLKNKTFNFYLFLN